MFFPDMTKESMVTWRLIFTAFIFTIKYSGHYELPILTQYSLKSVLNYVLAQDFIQLLAISTGILCFRLCWISKWKKWSSSWKIVIRNRFHWFILIAVVSVKPEFLTNITWTSCLTVRQQDRIHICFVEIPFFENLPRKKHMSYHFFKKLNRLIIPS